MRGGIEITKEIINLTILECKLIVNYILKDCVKHNKSNHIGM